jgi:hypothetical protein
MSKRGWIILGAVALLGIVVVYRLLEKKHEKRVDAAKEEQRHCEARNARFKIATHREVTDVVVAIPNLWTQVWIKAFERVREGQKEAEVEEILGQPVYTRCDVNQAGDSFEGSIWQYTMWMPPDMPNNLKNNTIQIEFGPDGRVQDKSMINVVTLHMRPSPSPSAAATSVNK